MTNALLRDYFFKERTILIILSDLLVIYGVLFMNFDVARMYGFYFIDFSVFLISYGVFNLLINKKVEITAVILAISSMLFLIGSFILLAINSILSREISDIQDAVHLFRPYYDVPVFAMLVVRAEYLNVKQLLKFDKALAKSEYSKLLLYNIFLIPILIFAAFFATKININLKISLIVALVLLRNIIEYLGYRSIIIIKRYNGL